MFYYIISIIDHFYVPGTVLDVSHRNVKWLEKHLGQMTKILGFSVLWLFCKHALSGWQMEKHFKRMNCVGDKKE
jgi:hypothetical protein